MSSFRQVAEAKQQIFLVARTAESIGSSEIKGAWDARSSVARDLTRGQVEMQMGFEFKAVRMKVHSKIRRKLAVLP